MSRLRPLSSVAVLVFSVLLAGCAAKRPVASRRPAPTQPTAAPSSTAKAAKRDTSVTPPPLKGRTPVAPVPIGYLEEGNASWYGNPFHGRRSSNGEIYDMNKPTAAHRTLPFDTMVRVTNLANGRSTTVRITDRGPFVDGRVIDLSYAAAREIESIGPGVVPVRLEVLGNVDVTSGFFTVQVGAFRERGNAERLRDRLNESYTPIFIQQIETADGAFYRVRVGRIAGEDAARVFGEQLRTKEGFTPFVVRLDEAKPSGGN